MELFFGVPVIIILILFLILAIVLWLAPIIIISQLNDIKHLLKKLCQHLDNKTVENSEISYSNNKQRSVDLLKKLFDNNENTPE